MGKASFWLSLILHKAEVSIWVLVTPPHTANLEANQWQEEKCQKRSRCVFEFPVAIRDVKNTYVGKKFRYVLRELPGMLLPLPEIQVLLCIGAESSLLKIDNKEIERLEILMNFHLCPTS